MELVDEVIERLKADSAVKAIVADRVYWIKPSNTPAGTYLTVIEAATTPADSADDEVTSRNITIQIDIWSKTAFRNLQKAVQNVIEKTMGHESNSGSDDWIPDALMYHKTISFSTVVYEFEP